MNIYTEMQPESFEAGYQYGPDLDGNNIKTPP
jgi:hypothetical protein